MRLKTRFAPVRFLRCQGAGLAGGAGLLGLLLLTGCAKPLVLDATLPQQFAEIDCVQGCLAAKKSCQADARYQYHQCEAGYDKRFRDYHWCLASAMGGDSCGYPWWPCAENLYGYCANRYTECQSACETRGY